MRATLRWAHADLRAHRGEALAIVLATAGIIGSLLLAGALFIYAADPWQRVFTQSSGAHVWLHTQPGTHTGQLSALESVTATAGPYPTVRTTVQYRGSRARVELRATSRLPETARPLLVAGSWPETDAGVVLESSLAAALWIGPGDPLLVRAGEVQRTLRVTGVADTAEEKFSRGETPGIGWIPRTAMSGLEPDGLTLGLRLADPADTAFTVQRAVTLLGSEQVTSVSRWREARAEAEGDNRLLGLLLALFGFGALLAAALAVAGAISSRIRGQLREIAVLKTIGFTPAQVVRMFLLQHLAYALLGVVGGVVLTEALGTTIPGRIGEAMELRQALPGHAWLPFATAAGTVLFIATATALAAWRAGRVSPIPAARAAGPAGRRMSAAVRRALALRVPPALLLGWRDAFHHPTRSPATVVRLAVPLLLVTVALSAWSTLDRFGEQPEEIGLPAALTARADGMDDVAARRLLAGHPGVAEVYPGAEVQALAPGQTGTITLRGLGSSGHRYPFSVAEGRAARGPDEAVAGQGLLDLLEVRVGDWVRMTVEGTPQILHIVGRSIEPEEGGRVISTALDTLQEGNDSLEPGFYQLVLSPGTDPAEVREELAVSAHGRLDIREVANPADRLATVRGMLVGLVAVLALISLTELSTTVGAGVRDRERDLQALRAVGLTPRQISAVLVAATGFTALAASLLGTVTGVFAARWLIDLQGSSSGMGAGIARTPAPEVLLLVVLGAVAAAAATATFPAARAGRHRRPDTDTPHPPPA